MARILDGAAIAAAIKQEVAEEVKLLAAQGIRPGLAAVLVGNVPASQIYVRNKVQSCAELGLHSELITGFSSSCRYLHTLIPKPCSTPSIPPRTWTAFTR